MRQLKWRFFSANVVVVLVIVVARLLQPVRRGIDLFASLPVCCTKPISVIVDDAAVYSSQFLYPPLATHALTLALYCGHL